MKSRMDSVEDCIKDFAAGKIVIIVDDENRENEGDMILSAELATPETVNIILRYARGLLCAPTTSERLSQIGIEDMVKVNRDPKGTAYTVTLDAATGVSTGISAADRARALNLMADFSVGKEAFVSPGHIQPLRARAGGVLERGGHTEASVDLARLAGLKPCCAICEIMNDDGTMARLPDLVEFKKKHNMKLMSVADLVEYRLRHEHIMQRLFEREIKTRFGNFKLVGLKSKATNRVHYALIKGDLSKSAAPLVRVHSENILGDIFADTSFSSGSSSFESAMRKISDEGCGALVYVSLPDGGIDPYSGEPIKPTARDYGAGSQILRELGISKMKLLTTHLATHKLPDGYGLEIAEEIQI
ncbi:MAG: 3,4-dihydroxy-2-butanone-4-phosphate synthase [Opitutales bacterium]|nr:3,4-dihydroxy-2-butanone-4-phosphate synthase [Opitutales bacterium]